MTGNTNGQRPQIFLPTALRLIDAGLTPILLDGKNPVFKDFTAHHVDPKATEGLLITVDLATQWASQFVHLNDNRGANVGLLMGLVVAVDVDDETIWQIIAPLLPPTVCIKRGRKGWTFFYLNRGITGSRIFRSLLDGHALLEILGPGRYTALPPSLHPQTGLPYEWVGSHWHGYGQPIWEALRSGLLGELTPAHVDALEAALATAGLVRVKAAEPKPASTVKAGELTADQEARLRAWVAPRRAERLEAVRTAGEGARQDALNRAVYDLARFVVAGVIDEDELRDQMKEACAENGFLKERGERRWNRDFQKALREGAALELPELQTQEEQIAARMGPAPCLPNAGPLPPAGQGGANDAGPRSHAGVGLSGLYRNDAGAVRRIIQNFDIITDHMGLKFTKNTFSQEKLINGNIITDDLEAEILTKIERDYSVAFTHDQFGMYSLDRCNQNSFHPLLEYLNGLVWDGKPRIGRWLIDYCGAEDCELVQQFSALWLIGAVKRIRQPGCEMSWMLIIEGEQGVLKSGMIKALAVKPEWFSDYIDIQMEAKNLIPMLLGKWLVEFGEMKNFTKVDAEKLKHFISSTIDRARLAWGRHETRAPRSCAFVGTTNNDTYLIDQTGNRRFWPVAVKECNVDAITAERDQLWAEAAFLEANGTSATLPRAMWEEAAQAQALRMVDDPLETEIIIRLANLPHDLTFSLRWLYAHMGIPSDQQLTKNTRMGTALKKLGFTHMQLGPKHGRARVYRRGAGSTPKL